jgi:hypothetical protein
MLSNNTRFYADKVTDLPFDVFDYQRFLHDWNISYIVLRDFEAVDRFRNDKLFDLVFENEKVVVFKINSDIG